MHVLYLMYELPVDVHLDVHMFHLMYELPMDVHLDVPCKLLVKGLFSFLLTMSIVYIVIVMNSNA